MDLPLVNWFGQFLLKYRIGAASEKLLDGFETIDVKPSESKVSELVRDLLAEVDLLQADLVGSVTWERGNVALRSSLVATAVRLSSQFEAEGVAFVAARLRALAHDLARYDQAPGRDRRSR